MPDNVLDTEDTSICKTKSLPSWNLHSKKKEADTKYIGI